MKVIAFKTNRLPKEQRKVIKPLFWLGIAKPFGLCFYTPKKMWIVVAMTGVR